MPGPRDTDPPKRATSHSSQPPERKRKRARPVLRSSAESPCLRVALSLILFQCASSAGCATGYKPCKEGGDTEWPGITKAMKGDVFCNQKLFGDKFLNHGRFEIRSKQGKTLLEGEFLEGERTGVWIQYNEQGEKLAEKFFERGVEKLLPTTEKSTHKAKQ